MFLLAWAEETFFIKALLSEFLLAEA